MIYALVFLLIIIYGNESALPRYINHKHGKIKRKLNKRYGTKKSN